EAVARARPGALRETGEVAAGLARQRHRRRAVLEHHFDLAAPGRPHAEVHAARLHLGPDGQTTLDAGAGGSAHGKDALLPRMSQGPRRYGRYARNPSSSVLKGKPKYSRAGRGSISTSSVTKSTAS